MKIEDLAVELQPKDFADIQGGFSWAVMFRGFQRTYGTTTRRRATSDIQRKYDQSLRGIANNIKG